MPGVTYQETVRAHIASLYPRLIDDKVVVQDGHITLPERPGLGVRLLEELFDSNHPQYRISRVP